MNGMRRPEQHAAADFQQVRFLISRDPYQHIRPRSPSTLKMDCLPSTTVPTWSPVADRHGVRRCVNEVTSLAHKRILYTQKRSKRVLRRPRVSQHSAAAAPWFCPTVRRPALASLPQPRFSKILLRFSVSSQLQQFPSMHAHARKEEMQLHCG